MAFFLAVLFWVVLDLVVTRLFPCRCGREVIWYFPPQHNRAGVMLARAVLFTAFTALAVFERNVYLAVIDALVSVWVWRIWWKHEQGKYKRRAARALGRIVTTASGRLVVQP